MSMSRVAALVLIIAGVLMLGYPVLSFTTREKVVDAGPIQVTRDKEHAVPLPPILGGVAVVAGIALLVADRRRA
jgi:UDP-N-acetylmuramyl pentapeptide phosphotransferase/UDP-N-acetylglucosamine-1-phosphate transferase